MRAASSLCVLLALTSCSHKTEITVKDPTLVSARVTDAQGQPVILPRGCLGCTVEATVKRPAYLLFGGAPQRVKFDRDPSGELHFEAPDTPGYPAGTLVTKDGQLMSPLSFVGADDAGRVGDDARVRYMVMATHGEYRTRTDPAFAIWMDTPRSNVTRAVVHSTPLRGVGVLLVVVGAALVAGGLGALTIRDPTSRAVGAAVLGGLGLAVGAGGVLLLTLPERTSPVEW